MYRKLETNKEFEKLITKTVFENRKNNRRTHLAEMGRHEPDPKTKKSTRRTHLAETGRHKTRHEPDTKKTTRPEHDTKINGSESGRHETDPNPNDPNPNDPNPTQIASLRDNMGQKLIFMGQNFKFFVPPKRVEQHGTI